MEWYEIIGIVIIWFAGIYLRGKFYEFRRDYNKNASWKSRGKE
jgi:hypothetical protein